MNDNYIKLSEHFALQIDPKWLEIASQLASCADSIKTDPTLLESAGRVSEGLGKIVSSPSFINATKIIGENVSSVMLSHESREASKKLYESYAVLIEWVKKIDPVYIANLKALIEDKNWGSTIDFELSQINFTAHSLEYSGETFSYEQIDREVLPKLANTENQKFLGIARDIWINVIFPVLLTLLTPLINKCIEELIEKFESTETPQEIKRQIQALPIEQKTSLTDFSVVSRYDLIVHQNPKMQSPKVALLTLGNVVERIDSKNDWTLVYFEDSETEIKIQGWVLTRYIKKIR